jgi:hypothetical protein
MYGDISIINKNDNIEPEKDEVNVELQDESKVGGDESESLMLSKGESESVMTRADEEKDGGGEVNESPKIKVTKKKQHLTVNNHFTRSKIIKETVLHVTDDKPPKPKFQPHSRQQSQKDGKRHTEER